MDIQGLYLSGADKPVFIEKELCVYVLIERFQLLIGTRNVEIIKSLKENKFSNGCYGTHPPR